MHTIHQKLHLQQHRHTGKLLHHRHTSYRGLAVVLVLAGVSMAAISMMGRAAADSLLGVSATVGVAVPQTAAIITAPSTGDVLSQAQTVVAGNCPLITPQVIIAIQVDGSLAGSGVCDSQNVFTVPVTLAAGSHSLVAQTYTITGGTGPAGPPLSVNYQPAVTTSPTAGQAKPLVITATTPVNYVAADRTATWNGTVSGGTAPYLVQINWGDGSPSEVVSASRPPTHQYTQFASYNLMVSASDSTGAAISEQFAAGAYTSLAGSTTAAFTSAGDSDGLEGGSLPGSKTIVGLYGLFVSLLSVSAIIWLEARYSHREAFALA